LAATVHTVLDASSVGERLRDAEALHVAGRLDDAERAYRGILAMVPAHADALHQLGIVLYQTGRPDDGLRMIDQALLCAPELSRLHNSRAAVLVALRRNEDALAAYDSVVTLDPAWAEAYYSRGNVLNALFRWEDAVASFLEAERYDSDFVEAQINRALDLYWLRRLDEARALYDRVLLRHPDNPDALYNSSLCCLAMGDLAQGWRAYEARWEMPQLASLRRELGAPRWRGDDVSVSGKTILLHAEQGLGDVLQFCRYAPLVAEQADVVLEVPGPLVRLLTSLPGRGRIVARGETLPRFDLHCPLLSLPFAFRTTLETIPRSIPYLTADTAAVAAWRVRLAALEGLRVGVCWAGNPAAELIDRRRSVGLARLAALGAVAGVHFVSLQKGVAGADATGEPSGVVIHDWTDELRDFADTAALVEALDLVITVDTAVAHLAGALGKPVWILSRFDACWRWLDGRDDSPWYPTARLFRQEAPGGWDEVVARVGDALREHVGPAAGGG
jgi:tetratricopeptide (TPR) repeat protein